MYSGCKPQYFNFNEVLSSVNQEELFFRYFGILPNSTGKFSSPFRSDKNPGCRFKWHSGILYLVENTMFNGKLYWSIFDCMMYLLNFSFAECLETITLDYKITTQVIYTKEHNTINKPRPEIRFTFKQWEKNLFDLPNDVLLKENIFLVDDYWIGRYGNFQKNPIYNPKETLTIAYYFPDSDHVKLYFPHEIDNRWYSNCDIYDIFGFNKLEYYLQKDNNDLIITKSQKDRIILDYHLGYNTIALQNEGCLIPEKLVEKIKNFKNQYILFDNDNAGIKNAEKLCQQYNFNNIYIRQFKDVYEGYKKYSINSLKKIIEINKNNE